MKALNGFDKNEIVKSRILAVDILCRFHPRHKDKKRPQMIAFFDDCCDMSSEKLVEQAMGHTSKIFNCITTKGERHNFTDLSECTAVSLLRRKDGWGINVKVGVGSKEKDGDLRLVVANQVTGKADFFFIPKRAWSKMSRKKGVITFSWNEDNQWYSLRLSEFQVDSFEELVNA